MTSSPAQERESLFREKTRKAVGLAMQARWDEAVEVNEALLADFAETEDVLNRLGRAFFELGRYEEAKKAFRRALDVAPLNTIARKNLEKLEALDGQERPVQRKQRIRGPRFIEESGKTGIVRLQELPPKQTLATLAAGDPVTLVVEGGFLWVKTTEGEPIGRPAAPLGPRLTRLIDGGNTYEAVLTSVGQGGVVLLVRETFRDPSQRSVTSFPAHLAGSTITAVDTSAAPELDRSYDEERAATSLVQLEDEDGGHLAEDALIVHSDGSEDEGSELE